MKISISGLMSAKIHAGIVVFGALFLSLFLSPSIVEAAPSVPSNVEVNDPSRPTLSWDASTPEPNGTSWNETAVSAWPERWGHASTVFDGKLWVMGGNGEGNLRVNDVWSSTEGENWVRSTDAADWSERYQFTSLTYDNKIWILGGSDESGLLNDVWYSTDGVSWTMATGSADWLPRASHTAVVFGGKMWVIGGSSTDGRSNDVWYSEDGINWTEATGAAAWTARFGHWSVVYDDKIWVMGGHTPGYSNDVWYSEDGIGWSQATDTADWVPRSTSTAAVFDDKIWVMGGRSESLFGGILHNDVWYSRDGVSWIEATDTADWTARTSYSSAVFDNKLWVMGGSTDSGSRLGDVWSTPNNSISHYVVCWDQEDGGCANSDTASVDGSTAAHVNTGSGLLAKSLTMINPVRSVHAQTGNNSYTVSGSLEPGTWHFKVAAVTFSGEQSPFSGTVSLEVRDKELPSTLVNTGPVSNFPVTILSLSGVFVLVWLSRGTIIRRRHK